MHQLQIQISLSLSLSLSSPSLPLTVSDLISSPATAALSLSYSDGVRTAATVLHFLSFEAEEPLREAESRSAAANCDPDLDPDLDVTQRGWLLAAPCDRERVARFFPNQGHGVGPRDAAYASGLAIAIGRKGKEIYRMTRDTRSCDRWKQRLKISARQAKGSASVCSHLFSPSVVAVSLSPPVFPVGPLIMSPPHHRSPPASLPSTPFPCFVCLHVAS